MKRRPADSSTKAVAKRVAVVQAAAQRLLALKRLDTAIVAYHQKLRADDKRFRGGVIAHDDEGCVFVLSNAFAVRVCNEPYYDVYVIFSEHHAPIQLSKGEADVFNVPRSPATSKPGLVDLKAR